MSEIFDDLVRGLASESCEVAENSKLELLKIIRLECNSSCLARLMIECQETLNSVIFVRYISLLVEISSLDSNNCNTLHSLNFPDLFLNSCLSEDPLLRIVMLDFIPQFAESERNYSFLYSRNILNFLLELCRLDVPSESLFGEQSLRVMSQLLSMPCSFDIVSLDIRYSFVNQIAEYLESSSESIRITGLVALSNYCSFSIENYSTCCNMPSGRGYVVFLNAVELFFSGKTQVEVSAVAAISSIFCAPFMREKTSLDLYERLSRHIKKDLGLFLSSWVKKTVAEVKDAVYSLIFVVMKNPWIIEVESFPELMSGLLSAEPDITLNKRKGEMLSELMLLHHFQSFGNEFTERIERLNGRNYFVEGPQLE